MPSRNEPLSALLGEGEERILKILESITDGFYGFDAEWRFIFVNDAAKRMLAPHLDNPEELLGQNYWESFPATRDTVIHEHFHRAVAEQTPVEFEVFYEPWSRWFSIRCFPVRGGGLSVYFQDFTEKKLAAEALRSSEQKYRSVLRSIDAGFCVIQVLWDESGAAVDYRFIEGNPAFETHTGLHGAMGRTARELIPGLEKYWPEVYGQVLNTGEPHRFTQGSDVMGRWFDVYAFPLTGSESCVGLLFSDISAKRLADAALQKAKEEAESSSRAKDEFIAALSHELRTPLTPVLMAADDLCERQELPEEVLQTLTMIRRNVALEARLIDDLLDFTRVANGKLALREQMCEVHSLVCLALEIVRDDAQKKAIVVNVELDAKLSHLVADPARIQQVFWNVLNNAVKFTPAGGSITLRSFNSPGRISIEVADTGVGIAAASLGSIFQPFDQGAAQSSHRFGGLGLGLSIAKAIVDMHGGEISAHSPGAEQGATFRIDFLVMAAVPAELAPPDAEVSAAKAPPGRPLKLLLVEDHEASRLIFTRLLLKDGHTVKACGTLREALELAAAEKFDAVISDIGLPDGTGVQLMAELHRAHGLTGIALSGFGMEEDLRRSREAGFVVHLVKPVVFSQLRSALARLTF